jgi:oxygen-independent coproporphyrinogen III oxidase
MDIEIIKKYNQPGPRYTSYPPATFFQTDFGNDKYAAHLTKSNSEKPENISFYLHIPFCRQLCHFCGCNTTLFQGDTLVQKYIGAVIKEIDHVKKFLDKNRKVSQIHWGGGTPNSIPLEYVEEIMDVLKKGFEFTENAEIAMECNPAYLEFDDIDRLSEMGFNRLSIGIQDFNPEILKAVNRLPSKHPVKDLVSHMKTIGFKGLNLDLIYGLPNQTIDNFKESIQKAIEISPDRLVTFSYAHVPWVKPAQKILEEIGLPGPDEKLAMFDAAHQLLIKAGYVSVGMDHYAKPGDELSIALRNKALHRNFQGYCTRETTGQVYGFGATSISQLSGAYIQNSKLVNNYIENINKNGLAVERGYELSFEDIVRREVISEIMCNGYLSFNEFARRFNISDKDLKKIVDFSEEKLSSFISDGLAIYENGVLTLLENGFYVVRNIAMAFDPLLKVSDAQYSKTV